jgi:hypothetical protein
MRLYPEIKLGLIMAFNTYSPVPNAIVADGIMNRFFPYQEPRLKIQYPLANLPEYDEDVDRFVGTYRFTRYSRNEISKVGLLMGMTGGELPIWRNDKGMLMMYDFTGKERRLVQVEPLFFQSIDDDYYVKFIEDTGGSITHLFTDGVSSFEKVPALLTIKMQKTIIIFSLSIFASVLFIGLFRRIRRRIKGSEMMKSSLFNLAELISGVFLMYLLLFGAAVLFFINPLEKLIGFPYGIPLYFYLLQILPFIFIVLIIWYAYKLIKVSPNGITQKSFLFSHVVFFSACLAGIWFLHTWNLIGFKF